MKKIFKPLFLTAGIALLLITLSSGTSEIPGSPERTNGGYRDMVEELYDQAVKQNDNLKSIEESIDKFEKKKADAMGRYNSFTSYNNRYYTDAKAKAATITDATARKKATDLIAQSEARYNSRLSDWRATITDLAIKEKELDDLHSLLMIVTTEPMISKYQSTELPDSQKLKDAANDLPGIIERIKAITQ